MDRKWVLVALLAVGLLLPVSLVAREPMPRCDSVRAVNLRRLPVSPQLILSETILDIRLRLAGPQDQFIGSDDDCCPGTVCCSKGKQ